MPSSKDSDDDRHQSLDLPHLARDLPTTPEDVAALKRLRDQNRSIEDLGPDWLNALAPITLFGPVEPRRTTSEGWEPFEL